MRRIDVRRVQIKALAAFSMSVLMGFPEDRTQSNLPQVIYVIRKNYVNKIMHHGQKISGRVSYCLILALKKVGKLNYGPGYALIVIVSPWRGRG